MIQAPTDVLVIAPHMDDETLGCGGIIALANNPMVVFAVESRDAGIEVADVAKALGFRYEVLYDKAFEARLLSLDRRELVGRLEEILHAERPSKVFIPSPSYHQDHVVTFEAALAATRPMSRMGYTAKFVAAYEYPGSAWRRDGGEERLNYYVNIEHAIGAKLHAIDTYNDSQRGRALVSRDIAESWARLRGSFVGVEYAEAFQILRSLEQSF